MMPCTQAELDIAKLDGCNIVWLAAPKEVIGSDGKVTALECSIMELGLADSTGRKSPVDTGKTFTLEVDMIIKAAGQMPYANLVEKESLDEYKGKVLVKDTSLTNSPGVFAGGDCVNGGKEVVDAVQAGKDAAAAIMRYLS